MSHLGPSSLLFNAIISINRGHYVTVKYAKKIILSLTVKAPAYILVHISIFNYRKTTKVIKIIFSSNLRVMLAS